MKESLKVIFVNYYESGREHYTERSKYEEIRTIVQYETLLLDDSYFTCIENHYSTVTLFARFRG